MIYIVDDDQHHSFRWSEISQSLVRSASEVWWAAWSQWLPVLRWTRRLPGWTNGKIPNSAPQRKIVRNWGDRSRWNWFLGFYRIEQRFLRIPGSNNIVIQLMACLWTDTFYWPIFRKMPCQHCWGSWKWTMAMGEPPKHQDRYLLWCDSLQVLWLSSWRWPGSLQCVLWNWADGGIGRARAGTGTRLRLPCSCTIHQGYCMLHGSCSNQSSPKWCQCDVNSWVAAPFWVASDLEFLRASLLLHADEIEWTDIRNIQKPWFLHFATMYKGFPVNCHIIQNQSLCFMLASRLM